VSFEMLDFEITSHLYKVAAFYRILGESRKAHAYKRAAMALDGFDHFVEEHLEKGNLLNVPGIGPSILRAVKEICQTGELGLEKTLAGECPELLAELTYVPQFGPALLRRLRDVGINSIDQMVEAMSEGRINLSQGAKKSFTAYIQSKNLYEDSFAGVSFPIALEIASELMTGITDFHLEICGEVSMLFERVRTLEFVAAPKKAEDLLKAFKAHRFFKSLISSDNESISAIILPHLKCSIHLASEGLVAFHKFVYSAPESHLNELKEEAEKQGLCLSEKGLHADGQNLAYRMNDDAEIYQLLHLEYIPPELRDRPVYEAQKLVSLLIDGRHIRGDLHCHSTWTDGIDPIESLFAKVKSLKYEYLAITDHSKSLRIAHGLSVGDALKQIDEISLHNQNSDGPRLLKGIEVEILKNGDLDYPAEILSKFDFVVAAVHSHLKMDKAAMTSRILRAIEHPNVHAIAHPTTKLTSRPGNLFAVREGCDMDLERIAAACAKHHVAFEVNAFPERLDLSASDVRKVLRLGAKITIGTDAHSLPHLDFMSHGISIARKAGCTENDVLNTFSWPKLKEYLYDKPAQAIETSGDSSKRRGKNEHLHRSSVRPTMKSLFGGTPEFEKTVVVGIDLTSSPKKATGWAALCGSRAHTALLKEDEQIIDVTLAESPGLVSIDSPLSLPFGRCCTRTNCECAKYGITRFCERYLMANRIGVFPCLIPSMVELTQRGIRLKKAFESQGVEVIESYPGGAQDILGIARKKRGTLQLVEGIKRFGIDLPNDSSCLNHDELDAITSALVGFFYLNRQMLALGDPREDYLIIPTLPAFEHESEEIHAIALAGETGAGKSTVALYLALHYGFHYARYSEIISQLAGYTGYNKPALQNAGLEVHESLGQREINGHLLQSIPNNTNVVIDGVRYLEDLECLREHFGDRLHCLFIECPTRIVKDRLTRNPLTWSISGDELDKILSHAAEREIFPLKFRIREKIENKGNFSELFRRVEEYVRSLMPDRRLHVCP
jgi:DNA polymerase (family 10)